MIHESETAWVLHKQWSGDTSARVTFFTRDHGVVRAVCKAGRTPKKQALLQAFTPLWVVFAERSGWYHVQTLELLSLSLPLEGHYLFAGLYVNELLYHALGPLDAYPRLYEAYTATLFALCHASDQVALEIVLRRFEWALLAAIGYGLSLTHEARTGLPIVSSQQYVLIAGVGLIGAEQGMKGAHLLALSDDALTESDVLKTAKKIMRIAIDHALGGKKIKTRDLYHLI